MTVTLSESPRLATLYGRAARGGTRHRGGPLPATELLLPDLAVDPARLAAYDGVCGFRLADQLPPTYPHVLAFPLQVRLMTDPGFPLALTGLVHVRNVISQQRALRLDERLTLRVHADRLVGHPRGTQVDLVTEVSVGDEVVWQERSSYLARGADVGESLDPTVPAGHGTGPDGPDGPATGAWRVGQDVGRRYARVSGDLNPIHLNPLAAKAFGFPRAIAHGMWAEARCLAALEGRLPDRLTVDVAFRKPLLLPSTVDLTTRATVAGWSFGLRSRSGAEHLVGATS